MLKRKRVVLSMKDKYEIIKRLEEGESATNLSNEYQVGKSTITDIKKQKASISNFISQLDSFDGSTSRKTLKHAANTDLDDAVYKWFSQKRSQGESISGPILCEKAVEFNEKLGGPSNFHASTGWLKRFKSRHGIRNLHIQGEKLSADSTTADSIKIKLRDVVTEKKYVVEKCDKKDIQQKWIEIDVIEPGYQIKQDTKTLHLMSNKDDATATITSSDREDEHIISASQALTCLDIALRWFEKQAESDQYQISVLKQVRDLAARKRVGLLQVKIEDNLTP